MLNRNVRNIFKVLLLLSVIFLIVYKPNKNDIVDNVVIVESNHYSSKEEVAAYIEKYDRLPDNFITKADAAKLGYKASLKNLWDVTDKYSIGGDIFFNRENLLPSAKGRIYYECDIDFDGKNRGAKRIVFSNDGLIYYTDDHYDSFELLVGD